MADIIATISNIGLIPILGTLLIISIAIAAFSGGNTNKDDKKKPDTKSSEKEGK